MNAALSMTSQDVPAAEMCYRPLKFLASLAFAALLALIAPVNAFSMTSQDVPAADLPTAAASPTAASTTSSVSAASPLDLQTVPTESTTTPEPSPAAAAEENATGDGNDNALGNDAASEDLGTEQPGGALATEPAAEATEPPPALDAAALTVGPELGNASLDPEISKAITPALAASLRLTESARKQLSDGQIDNAMRELARAVSVDPSDAFAYYYLGRSYLQKKNYGQALTFFRRAEIGFNGRPDWTAEALSYEGACDEELGKPNDAVQAYQRALARSPNNLRARVGYGRLAAIAGPVGNLDASPPEQDLSAGPPGEQEDSAPSEESPPRPPEDAPPSD